MPAFLIAPLFFLLVASGPLLYSWIERRRRREMMIFAQVHGLAYLGQEWPLGVPSPEAATSWILGLPTYRNVVSGVYRDVRVLAFDFGKVSGRSREIASGLAIEGDVVPGSLPTFRRVELQRFGSWSFLITKPGIFSRVHRLRPEEIQSLWNVLIEHSACRPNPPHSSVPPGNLHIRPRR